MFLVLWFYTLNFVLTVYIKKTYKANNLESRFLYLSYFITIKMFLSTYLQTTKILMNILKKLILCLLCRF